MAGIALDVIAFPAQAELGTVAPEKLFALGVAVGPIEMLLYLLSLVFLRQYRLTRAQHSEVIRKLAIRNRAA